MLDILYWMPLKERIVNALTVLVHGQMEKILQ